MLACSSLLPFTAGYVEFDRMTPDSLILLSIPGGKDVNGRSNTGRETKGADGNGGTLNVLMWPKESVTYNSGPKSKGIYHTEYTNNKCEEAK